MSKPGRRGEVSAREAEILDLIGDHRSNAEIAAQLFISVRTVETHVSSLLRKLGAPDRRALADLATEFAAADRATQAMAGLPSPLDTFVGRAAERRELASAVTTHRAVTAVGPGGVGKTRLALAVAADLAGTFVDGVWFVSLVPVTDPAMVGSAVAAALGVGEQPGRGVADSVFATLADRRALLVLDNCEHVADGVAPFVERLLAGCPDVTVLGTSRARLLVPFERVYAVPPLSLDVTGSTEPGDGRSPDAVALFADRAAAVGWTVQDADLDRVAEVCRALDGVALAIELAAARLPTLGFDGLVAGLSDHLRLLVGGYRADDRHRSVRAMLDWSQALLSEPDLTVLRRVSVFVSSFTASAAQDVAGFGDLAAADVVDGLARLADQSLLAVSATAGGVRYRALETIRQYGDEQLSQAGEDDTTKARHLTWSLTLAESLVDDTASVDRDWRARFDAMADDLRAALTWAAGRSERRGEAYRLASTAARLAFTRTLIGESQHRFEQAAALADDPADAAAALRSAANVAACRMNADDAYRLWQQAADVALRAGDQGAAARDLATATATYFRKAGAFDRRPPRSEAETLLDRARRCAGDDRTAQAAIALAECAAAGYAYFAEQTGAETDLVTRAEHAAGLTRGLDDPVLEGAALQALTAAHRQAGDAVAAAATASARVEVLESVPLGPGTADELIDALLIATATSIGVGDLPGARRWGRRLRDLPLLAEVGHVATSRILMADALAGYADDVVVTSGRFLDGWTRAGRPPARHLGPVAASVAMIHDLRGEHDRRDEWLGLLEQWGFSAEDRAGFAPTLDAITLLHQGLAARALDVLDSGDEQRWRTGILFHWHVALRAEATVLAGRPDADAYVANARPVTSGNPIAAAILDRAAALRAGDRSGVLATADAFEAADCPYQRARTLILAGGDTAPDGYVALAGLGIPQPAGSG